MVASAAISFAKSVDRGVVVKTTKYGIVEVRENVTEVGKVTYESWFQNYSKYSGLELSYRTSKRNGPIRSERHLQPRLWILRDDIHGLEIGVGMEQYWNLQAAKMRR